MSTKKKLIFINTAPKANTKKDGSVFYTVLVGLSKSVLDEKGASDADRITMNVFPNQLEEMTKSFVATKKAGVKLALACDDIVVTEPKANTYINKDGESVTEMQASCWADGPSELTIVKSTMTISEDLKRLLGDDDGDGDILV